MVNSSLSLPSNNDGSADLTILESALNDIANICTNEETIILIRSTIIPGTTRDLQSKFDNLKLVFNPEFLTERSANFDFINQSRAIFGGEKANTNKVADLFRWRFGDSFSILETNFESAELIKYMANTFFATKVSIMNEFKLLCDKIGANWDDALRGFVSDSRIADSHLNVPGHDGKFGYGGTCFPKDVSALLSYSKKHEIELNSIAGGWITNLKVRPEKDWEKKEGRSVSFKKTKLK